MLFKSKSNRGLIKNQDFTLQNISTLSKVLLAQQDTTKYISKEIKNEVQLGQKNERAIDRSIVKINEEAECLIRRYEQEKEMNQKLEFLVKNIEEELYQTKLDKSTDLKANIETDKLLECSNILDSRQKDLQKISEKINSSSYDLAKKLDSIRALRSERTIFSTLFDKIQRELCDLEHCYQVLVIQRNIGQQLYKQSVDQFSKEEATTNRQLDKLSRKVEESLREQQQTKSLKLNAKTNQPNDKMNRNSTVPTNNEEGAQKGNHLSEFYKQKGKQKKNKLQTDFQKLKRERIVKIILNDLAISSVQELPSNLQKLEEGNEELLKEATSIYDQILHVQQNITHLSKRKNKASSKNTKRFLQDDKKLLILEATNATSQSRSQVNQFRHICKILIKDIMQSSKNNEGTLDLGLLNEEEEIRYLMGQLQTFLQNSYLQNKSCLPKTRQRESLPPKRLTYFINNHLLSSHLSICEEKELLDFAKNNLQRMDRRTSKIQK